MEVSLGRLLNRISATYVILFCFVPSMQVENIYRIIALGASALWIATALGITSFLISKQAWNFILIASICIILMFYYRTNMGSVGSAFANVLQPIIIIIVALISMFMFEHDSKFFNYMMTIILIVVCIYCVITIQATIENPYASRIANSEWLEDRYEGNEHVGLYGYVYMCVFLVPILLYKIIRNIRVNFIVDMLTYVAISLIIIMIALAGYMIAIFCAILGIAMVMILNKVTWPRILLVVAIGVFTWRYQEQIIAGILDIVAKVIGDNPIYTDKLNDFILFYEEGELGDSSWGGRFKNYAASIKEVINYPVLGSYFYGKTLGGGHSQILDTIGKFGWLVSYFYFKITWDYPRRLVEGVSKKHALYVIVLVITIIFGILDPYCQEMALPWFIMMPYVVYLEREQTKQLVRRKA